MLSGVNLRQGRYRWLTLSPNGTKVLLERFEQQKVGSDIWSFDLARETYDRLTADAAANNYPLWSLDGKHISLNSDREGAWAIWQKGVNGNDDKAELVFRKRRAPSFKTIGQTMGSISCTGKPVKRQRVIFGCCRRPLTVVQNWTALLKK